MKSVAHIFIFFASLVVSAKIMSPILPPAVVPQFSEKLAWFAAHKDDYDAVFIGSSQFYHGINPRQFDRVPGRAGRSFNFGLDGLWPAESFFVLRQILAQKPQRLRWVFIDWMDIDARIDPGAGTLTTRRMLYWHDTLHTAMTLHRIIEQPDSSIAKAELASAHLVLWARCLLHHGQAVDWFEAKLRKVKRVRARTPDWAANDGWRPGETGGLKGDALAKYAAQLDKLRHAGPRAQMGAALQKATDEAAAEIRAAGATPVLIASPAADPRHYFAPPAGIDAWIFNDPARYPDLFRPELRYDNYHLNPRGAELLTRLLADRFAETLKSHP